jgi:hypothetical protein
MAEGLQPTGLSEGPGGFYLDELFGAACGLQPRNEKSDSHPRASSTGSE